MIEPTPPWTARLVRRVAAQPRARLVAGLGYRAAAHAAARILMQARGVDGVYLTGSATQLERLRPGFSDIDLMLASELSSLDSELELRNRLARFLKVANTGGRLFKHLDYIEHRDLALLAQFGNAWGMDSPRAWLPLAGRDRRPFPPVIAKLKWRIERAIAALRRWQGASSTLLDPTAGRPLDLMLIGATRTFCDVASSWLGVDRLCPFETLLSLVRLRPAPGPTCFALASRPSTTARRTDPDLVVELLTASLEILDGFVAELTEDWSEVWRGFERRPTVECTGALHRLGKIALEHGFRAVYRSLDRAGHDALFVVTHGSQAAALSIENFRHLLGSSAFDSELRHLPRPVLLTPALFRAAALLDPAPFAGADLAVTAECIAGEGTAGPLRPSRQPWDHLVAARITQILYRPRGRSLRAGADRQAALRKLWRDVEVTGSAVLALAENRTIALERLSTPPLDLDEAELVARLRDQIEAARETLRSWPTGVSYSPSIT